MFKREVIDLKIMEGLSPLFKGKMGHRLARLVMRIFAIDKVNWVYGRSCYNKGAAFAHSLLKDLGVKYRIGNAERLQHLPENSFITISNHPYGGIDGIMLIDLMVSIRSDYKIMVNQFLSYVRTMEENFISVRPKVGKKSVDPVSAFNGIRETLTHLQEGHPVGFFPAGAVSMFFIKNLRVKDREWQESVLKLIQKAKVPVVPIRFFDKNSPLFYFLGVVNWRIRLIRMPYEIFNKSKQYPRIGIGNVITVEEMAKYTDYKSLGNFLREMVYGMPMPETFIPRSELSIQPI